MARYLSVFSGAAFCFFLVGCLLELLALLGVNSIPNQDVAFALFGGAFFLFWLPAFILQFRSPYKESLMGAFAPRLRWAEYFLGACVLGWLSGWLWVVKVWESGGPEIRNGQYVLWLKGSNQYLPLTASEYNHDMAIMSRILSTWIMLGFLMFALFYRRMAQVGDPQPRS